jgi:hypothetical protein
MAREAYRLHDSAEVTFMSDKAELLASVGKALYGAQWRSEMARSRNVRSQVVDEWAAGKGPPIPSGVWAELRAELEARRSHIVDLLDEVRQA